MPQRAARRSHVFEIALGLRLPGVYRRLAEAVSVLDERPARARRGLLEVRPPSRHCQIQPHGSRRGRAARRDLTAAVTDGLARGEVARGPRWGGWRFFFDHLRPFGAGAANATPGARSSRRRTTPARRYLSSSHPAAAATLREADCDGDLERTFSTLAARSRGLVRLLDASTPTNASAA